MNNDPMQPALPSHRSPAPAGHQPREPNAGQSPVRLKTTGKSRHLCLISQAASPSGARPVSCTYENRAAENIYITYKHANADASPCHCQGASPPTYTYIHTHNDVEVQVVDALGAIGPVVDHDAKAAGGQSLLLRHVLRDKEQVAVRGMFWG